MEIHSRHGEGGGQKTLMEGVSSYMCIGALHTPSQGQRNAVQNVQNCTSAAHLIIYHCASKALTHG